MTATEVLSRNLRSWAGLGLLAVVVVNFAGEEIIHAQLAEENARHGNSRLSDPLESRVSVSAMGANSAAPLKSETTRQTRTISSPGSGE